MRHQLGSKAKDVILEHVELSIIDVMTFTEFVMHLMKAPGDQAGTLDVVVDESPDESL